MTDHIENVLVYKWFKTWRQRPNPKPDLYKSFFSSLLLLVFDIQIIYRWMDEMIIMNLWILCQHLNQKEKILEVLFAKHLFQNNNNNIRMKNFGKWFFFVAKKMKTKHKKQIFFSFPKIYLSILMLSTNTVEQQTKKFKI